MAKSFLAGKLPLAVRGGYDFVDVRDVARGIPRLFRKRRARQRLYFVRPLCHHSQDASARGKDCKAEVSTHLLTFGSCKAGGSILRTSESEGPKAVVFHPVFRFRSCLKRAIQPCRSNEMLCISAAPDRGDLGGYDSLAFGAEKKGRSVTSHQQKAPWAGSACY